MMGASDAIIYLFAWVYVDGFIGLAFVGAPILIVDRRGSRVDHTWCRHRLPIAAESLCAALRSMAKRRLQSRMIPKRAIVPTAHRFSRSSYCASRRLYVAQRMRGGLGGKSYSSSVAPPHLSCSRLASLRARSEAY